MRQRTARIVARTFVGVSLAVTANALVVAATTFVFSASSGDTP
jgi:hypothetical protein